MFYLAAFPQFVDLQSHDYFEAFVLVLIHAILMTIWFISVYIVVSNIKQLNSESIFGRWVQRLCGGILIIFSSILVLREN